MIPERITLVTLGVADLARSKDFYGRLGWRPVAEQEGIAFYQLHGQALALFGLADLAADQGRAGAALGTGAITLAQNFATVEEVKAAFGDAVAAGATPLKPPVATEWGGYSGYFADPDGHVWELAHNPFWPLNDDGSLTLPASPDSLD
ncbi:glyoxalase [Haematobacter massiliensis]|uniref:VOC family protein n=1 Tax=Haematobacter massiliensis TaxID=195105 RepID=UPI000B4A3A74|nr:VOC family protein [Haematobacter massiliensis]OWJ69667.1 glyoxalase [Haematobacter massiliensis]QBJ23244.1 VOC family protein [Haematobacter massiliensis]